MAKYYHCKHCHALNKVNEKDFIDTIEDNAAPLAGRALIMLLAGAVTAPLGGVGAVVAGALFTVEGARDYLSLECGSCGQRFFINRLE